MFRGACRTFLDFSTSSRLVISVKTSVYDILPTVPSAPDRATCAAHPPAPLGAAFQVPEARAKALPSDFDVAWPDFHLPHQLCT